MRNAKAKVYMEFLDYKGDVNDKALIAEFCHEYWADTFIQGYELFVPDRSESRLVKEVANA